MPNSKHYLLGFWAAMVSPVILLQASWGPETEGECFGLCGVVYKNKNQKTLDLWTFAPLDLWVFYGLKLFFG